MKNLLLLHLLLLVTYIDPWSLCMLYVPVGVAVPGYLCSLSSLPRQGQGGSKEDRTGTGRTGCSCLLAGECSNESQANSVRKLSSRSARCQEGRGEGGKAGQTYQSVNASTRGWTANAKDSLIHSLVLLLLLTGTPYFLFSVILSRHIIPPSARPPPPFRNGVRLFVSLSCWAESAGSLSHHT